MQKRKHHDESDDDDELAVHRTLAPPSSEMNVTPLIDVLLVLLIIFMSVLPLTQKGVDINLPLESKAETKPTPPDSQVVVELSSDLRLAVNKQTVALPNLEEKLRGIFEARKDKTVFIIGPTNVRYGDMMPVIDIAIGVGLKVAIVTQGMRLEAGAR